MNTKSKISCISMNKRVTRAVIGILGAILFLISYIYYPWNTTQISTSPDFWVNKNEPKHEYYENLRNEFNETNQISKLKSANVVLNPVIDDKTEILSSKPSPLPISDNPIGSQDFIQLRGSRIAIISSFLKNTTGRKSFLSQEGPLEFSMKNHEIYAQINGFDNIHIASEIDPQFNGGWNKVIVLRKYIENYDWVIWVDHDAYFLNFQIPFKTMLHSVQPSVDLKMEGYRTDIDGVMYSSLDHTWEEMAASRGYYEINTGIMLLRNSPWTINLLDKVAESKTNSRIHHKVVEFMPKMSQKILTRKNIWYCLDVFNQGVQKGFWVISADLLSIQFLLKIKVHVFLLRIYLLAQLSELAVVNSWHLNGICYRKCTQQ
ncbi:hypothetical protein HK096_001903 [Nowakowskiella sp. JEL0078]|nr:hypothetical protein HK096_001903 [Nowakowskiella sp. JEL0078]